MLKHIWCVLCLSPVFSSGRNWWELLPKWIALNSRYLFSRLEMLTSLGAFTPCSSLYKNTKYFHLPLETMEFWIDYFQAGSISSLKKRSCNDYHTWNICLLEYGAGGLWRPLGAAFMQEKGGYLHLIDAETKA